MLKDLSIAARIYLILAMTADKKIEQTNRVRWGELCEPQHFQALASYSITGVLTFCCHACMLLIYLLGFVPHPSLRKPNVRGTQTQRTRCDCAQASKDAKRKATQALEIIGVKIIGVRVNLKR